MNVRAGGFLDAYARQKRATGARVVACAVRARSGVDMVQAAENLQAFFDVLQRLHRAVEFKVFVLPGRPPIGRYGSVREIDEGHPQWRSGGRSRQRTSRLRIGREHTEWPESFER